MNYKKALAIVVIVVAFFGTMAIIRAFLGHEAGPSPLKSSGLKKVVQTRATVAKPDSKFDNFTYTLPNGASAVKLTLPADLKDIFDSAETGVGAFGLHEGAHIEGLDHVWIELKEGTPIKSWADGVVQRISLEGMKDQGETHVQIDYGDNLVGIHMEVGKVYVKEGERVKRGQEIGRGLSFGQGVSSGEFALADRGRSDGPEFYNSDGVFVSPYDYLRDDEKRKLIAAYKKHAEKYNLDRSDEGHGGFTLFFAHEPYLTNDYDPYEKGKITGAWYSLQDWKVGYPNDVMTFIEADNSYVKGNKVMTIEDQTEAEKHEWSINGTFEIDYAKKQIVMVDKDYKEKIYGIFEIDDSGKRAKLKIEYQKGSFPSGFSSKALDYIQRSNKGRRIDGYDLGVSKSRY